MENAAPIPQRIGFIGAGKMASAIGRGLLDAGIAAPDELVFSDPDPAARERVLALGPVHLSESNAETARGADVVLLCVKPAEVGCALVEIGAHLEGRLLVSIAAGVPLHTLEAACPQGTRVVRVMPNTPALVRQGATAYAPGTHATTADAAIVERIFSSVGLVLRIEEKLLDAVTGLSGSGPAFILLVLEALADGGVLAGLPRPVALTLAAQTVRGAAELVLRTGRHPGQLRDDVTSPGGTTIEGLAALERAGARSAFIEAVVAAAARSRQLAHPAASGKA